MNKTPPHPDAPSGLARTTPTSRRRALAMLGVTAATMATPSGGTAARASGSVSAQAAPLAMGSTAAPRTTLAPVVVNVQELGARGAR